MHSLELAPRYRVRRRFAIVEATASRRDALVATTLQDQLQHALGDRYRIARELTPGGMSRLFLATEESLDRQVVVKLLPPEAASEVSAERFRREMLVTARLQHPHVHDEHHRHAHGPDDPEVTDPKPHSHAHRHEPLVHTHPHYPDIHHRHGHE
jgi:serine/threonine protein kinase